MIYVLAAGFIALCVAFAVNHLNKKSDVQRIADDMLPGSGERAIEASDAFAQQVSDIFSTENTTKVLHVQDGVTTVEVSSSAGTQIVDIHSPSALYRKLDEQDEAP